MTTAAIRVGTQDVREGGRWTRTQRIKNALIAGAVRASLALLAPLPARALRALGYLAGCLALLGFGRARRTAIANLRMAFPDMSSPARRALLRRVYVTLGGHLGDAVASLAAQRSLAPLPIDEASLALLTRRDRGVVFASAHLGPWEHVAQSLVARGVPLTVLARRPYDPRLSFLYDRMRSARGVGAIYRGGVGSAARIVRALRRGEVLGIPMDLRSRVPSIDAPFLGRTAATPVGPARIALRTGADVVVGTVAPCPDGSLRITCTPILTDDLHDAPEHERERILTARINEEISSRILALPSAWVWMHDRFGDGLP